MNTPTDRQEISRPWGPIAAFGLIVASLAVAATGLAVASNPTAGDGEEQTRIRVKRIVTECEGEDCPEGSAHAESHARAIFVGEDGEVREVDLGAAGGDVEWISDDGARRIVQRLHPDSPSGYLGVLLNPMTPELRAHLGAPEDAGVQVSKVIDDSPAWRAGLQVGDVVTAVDGTAIASPGDLSRAIGERGDGDTVSLEIWRDGSVQTVVSGVEERAITHHPVHVVRREMLGDGGSGEHEVRIVLDCDGEECEEISGDWEFEPFDCGGAEECEVRVECTAPGACDCTVNGEATDCATIPGPHND